MRAPGLRQHEKAHVVATKRSCRQRWDSVQPIQRSPGPQSKATDPHPTRACHCPFCSATYFSPNSPMGCDLGVAGGG